MEPITPSALLQGKLDRIIRAFSPERIILFGSYAKGTARPGSDIDLLIVAELEGDSVIHMRRARQLVADAFPPIDIVLCTPEEAAEAHKARSPFLMSIVTGGVIVYKRP